MAADRKQCTLLDNFVIQTVVKLAICSQGISDGGSEDGPQSPVEYWVIDGPFEHIFELYPICLIAVLLFLVNYLAVPFEPIPLGLESLLGMVVDHLCAIMFRLGGREIPVGTWIFFEGGPCGGEGPLTQYLFLHDKFYNYSCKYYSLDVNLTVGIGICGIWWRIR